MNNDTICALATATGGALAIIRVSGPDAFSIVSSISSVSCEGVTPNTVHYAHIINGNEIIDDVMVSVFHAPRSYTGEDSVEITCHASSYICNKVLSLLVENGCRTAGPGEYTMRAYLNGKLDLSQAEAVADLIASTNKASHDIAMSQLRGHFSSELKTLRDQLLKLTSLLELELDFSDHEDLEFADRMQLLHLAETIDNHIYRLANSFKAGQALKEGIPVAIVGKTNVGKSTLLNALLKDDRAIVSDIHGTTRDTIEETMVINGVQFRFIDTAGLRKTSDEVEQIGINRTYQAIDKARIVLWLFDKAPTTEEVTEFTTRSKKRTLIPVLSKIDINEDIPLVSFHASLLKISAKTGQGMPELRQYIFEEAQKAGLIANSTDVIITNARHYEALTRAHQHLQLVLDGLQIELSGDLLAEDLKLVLTDLSEITGEGQITSQEILNNIFSHFCVGK